MYNVHLTHSLLCFEFVEFTLIYIVLPHLFSWYGDVYLVPSYSQKVCHSLAFSFPQMSLSRCNNQMAIISCLENKGML